MMKPLSSGKQAYFQYLQQRSLTGWVYRNWFLYPRLSACLDDDVLDFGCGIGDFLRFRPNTTGVDINLFNIDYCHLLGLKAELLGERGCIPYPDDTFSGVVMDNVIEHIPVDSVDTVLKEVLRVLRRDGQLLVGVPGLKGYDSDDDHKCYYSEQDLIALLGRYGCRKVKSFHMPVHMPWLENHLSQYCIYVLFSKA